MDLDRRCDINSFSTIDWSKVTIATRSAPSMKLVFGADTGNEGTFVRHTGRSLRRSAVVEHAKRKERTLVFSLIDELRFE